MNEGSQNPLLKGAMWIGATRLVMNLVAFASTLILARLLLPEDFGIVAIAESVAMIVMAITELSLANALIQHKNPQKHHYDTAFTMNVVRSVALALVIAGLAFPAAAIYGDPRLIDLLLVIALTAVISGFENPKIALFHRELIFWQEFVLNVASKLAGFIVAVALAYAFRSYWALILGSLAAQTVRIFASYLVLPYLPRFSMRGYKELLSFSVWLTLSSAIKTINGKSDTLAVGLFVAQSSVGQYVMGGRLAFLPVREGLGPVRKVLFPAFARMQDNLPRLQAAYMKAQGMICTLAFPIGLGLAVVADPLVPVLIGEKWQPAVPIVQVLAFVSAFQVVESSHQLAMSLGHTDKIFHRDLRVFIIRFPLLIIGLLVGLSTPVGAVMGLIAGRAAASAINILLNLQLVREIAALPIRKQLGAALRPAVAALIMAGIVMASIALLRNSGQSVAEYPLLALVILIGAISYLVTLALLWFGLGRPGGPEREFLKAAHAVRSKLSQVSGYS